jgi:DNA-binding transcriptional ArsR family regulator
MAPGFTFGNTCASVFWHLAKRQRPIWPREQMKAERIFRALANEHRLEILLWLQDPRRHFPLQIDGDLVQDGVCGCLIARKLRVSHPTASEHLKILSQVGLIRGKRIKQWTFYKRDETEIKKIKRMVFPKI